MLLVLMIVANQVLKAVWRLGSTPSIGLYLAKILVTAGVQRLAARMLLACLVGCMLGQVLGWLLACWLVLIRGLLLCTGANQVLNAVWRLGSTPSTGLLPFPHLLPVSSAWLP